MLYIPNAKLEVIYEDDLGLLLSWRNKEFIRNVMFNSDIITWEQHEKWYANLKKNESSVSKIFYYEDRPLGLLNLYNIDHKNNKLEWGFYIGEEERPKGMGLLLGYVSLNYIFEKLNFRKLNAEVIGFNQRSVKLHQKLGFNQEGLLRKHIKKDSSYYDLHLFGLFQEQWKSSSNKIKKLIEEMSL